MSKMQDVFAAYSGSLTDEQKDQLYSVLKEMKPSDLVTLEDHRLYIEALAKLRSSIMRGFQLMGKNFISTLESLLAVGEDGVYSNGQRFIYELIQNVDDCDYADSTDCHLDIRFHSENGKGQITFEYNETGFKPENVFAITGIAEASKNISADKVEIGEKGIGFKSVFGIADKVHIESGMFSFMLTKENFTVPVPCYDNFRPVNGTRLILEMPEAACMTTYRSLVNLYVKKDAILNKNPVLFLNKLTHLKMYVDSFRYIEFDVQRVHPEHNGCLQVESDVIVSVDMKDHYNGLDQAYNGEVHCYRYTLPITYGRKECVSRYGEDVAFTTRNHNLIAVFPVLTKELDEFKGRLYSFLPTQIKTTAPVILHVPYKLDGSREFVHAQGKNAWFTYTNAQLATFLKEVYLQLSRVVAQDIIRYIPRKGEYLFKCDNEKIECLCIPEFNSETICAQKIFLTENAKYEDISHIVSFGKDENISDPVYVHELLRESTALFIPSHPFNMKNLGARTIENVPMVLFAHGLTETHSFHDILLWIEKNNTTLNYSYLLERNEPIRLNEELLVTIAMHPSLCSALLQRAKNNISNRKNPAVLIDDTVQNGSDESRKTIQELVVGADLDDVFEKYLKHIEYKFFVVPSTKVFAVAASNGIVLSLGSELGAFSIISQPFDSGRTFSASLRIRQASEKLNQVDDSLSNGEYLMILRGVRKSLKDAFGTKMYQSYTKIIAEAGTDKTRFLSELLQNADDCNYSQGGLPVFMLRADGQIVTVSYNEDGFTKDNVRAITAIGESTKKLLLTGDDHSIGEKGVGFKSVFGVAKSVEIHSNGFDFSLSDINPTIPEKCSAIEQSAGTTMLFHMKEDIREDFSAERLLQLCTCLRNLKSIRIASHQIDISDENNQRIITIDGQKHVFERIIYSFEVTDRQAIAERNTVGRVIEKKQQIVCYLPERVKDRKMLLYSGLPLSIECNVPLIIDTPFELTTSRENVLHNHWNTIVREHMYKAILQVMEAKRDTGLDVLRYVGFRSQGGVITWQNFSDDYLNVFNWTEALRQAPILPLLSEKRSVAVCTGKCTLIPEFIAKLQPFEDVASGFQGRVIDMRGKSQYVPLLESIGCKKTTGLEILSFLSDYTEDFIINQEFQEGLYAYLSNTQGNNAFESVGDGVLRLPIFPVRTKAGTEYIPYNSNIYTHTSEVSKEDYYILNREVMSLELADKILGKRGRINALTQEVFDAKYQQALENYIVNSQHKYTAQQIAMFVLGEYKNHRLALSRCRNLLLGLKDRIPFLMANGKYKAGSKFLNTREQWYAGNLILSLVVDEAYADLGNFLELEEIEQIHYDDIADDIANTSDIDDEDLNDLSCDFANYTEIITHLVNEGLISDRQIAEFHLDFAIDCVDDGDQYEEFPGKSVANMGLLRSHIKKLWNDRPNRYVESRYICWRPQYPMDKSGYTLGMYQSRFNKHKCFCQKCGKLVPLEYIERNDIEKNPAYAWEQMHLNLCLMCSKDYQKLRYNDAVWNQFIKAIMSTNVLSAAVFAIPMGSENTTISFTATHLAEVQEIFRNEGWGEKAPKRKAVIGSSDEDEVY